MKADRETKRLFVGGLGQNVSEVDLQNQFSRFGEVSDVEIITRKDDQGNPQKVFAYINLRVAETDLKKCMSVLNKTKWKGGTLKVQLAKESFLHRLAQERQEAKAKKEKSTTVTTKLLEKTGVADRPVKAVPGTEVLGRRNWVVSKFGRVLPVLHLKDQHKHKIKYDPSKYCHNLKKIGEDFPNVIPISNLTWELEGGNDPMSKKRRGEFSDFHSPPKKMVKAQKNESSTAPVRARAARRMTESPHLTQHQATQEIRNNPIMPNAPHMPESDHQKVNSVFFQTSGLEPTRRKNGMSDDDSDSEAELRLMVAREENLQRTTWSSVNESDNDSFEVVRDDLKSDVHKLCSLPGLSIKNVSCLDSEDNVGNDCNYDSGDTDEIIAMNKNAGKVKHSTEFSQMEKSISKNTALKNKKNSELSGHCVKVSKQPNTKLAISHRVKRLNSPSDSGSNEDADSLSQSAESEEDEYKSMMENCLHVTLTLAELEQLARSDLEAPKADTESDGWKATPKCDRVSKTRRTSRGLLPRGRQCIRPEEIVASLLEGEDNAPGKQKPEENDLKPTFQAFKGVGCLYRKESVKKSLKESVSSDNNNQDPLTLEDTSSMSIVKSFPYANGSSSELIPFQHAKKADDPDHIQPQERQSTFESHGHKVVSSSSSEKGSRNSTSTPLPSRHESSSLGTETPKRGLNEDCCHSTTKTGEGSEKRPDVNSHRAPGKPPEVSSRTDTRGRETDFPLPFSSDVTAKGKHVEDNQKRLAALEARQKEKELQKKLVHNALANLDGQPEDKPTHIVFGSDSESETGETNAGDHSHLVARPVNQSLGRASGKLFGSSDDEEPDSEDDSSRFRIKPQFEGRAGKKLMDLQSRFASDDRFRMDSRFLESDSEEEQEEVTENKTAEEAELAAEKSKALDVLQSILHVSLSSSASKGSATAKKFKDVIHYDPTRHDHATYERKRDDKPKESKARRKKKREEAEKLPEVSKDTYYSIAADLKEILQTKEDVGEEEDLLGSEDHSVDRAHAPEAQPSGGFTFSFFDSDAEDVKEETYRAETVRPGRTACQRGPRLQDSSSEEEEVTEETGGRTPSPGEASVPEKETTRFFFFSKNDERLHGFDLFWKGTAGNVSRNAWEARTTNLRMDCRKKHKDAKRRVKPK